MMFRNSHLASALVLATLLVTMAGCGRHNPALVDEPAAETPAPVASATPAPVATPTPQPSTPDVPVVTGNLQARLQNFQTTGVVSRTQIATIEVTNPTSATLSGQPTCTFDSSKSNATQTQNVSLTPREVRTFTFEVSYTSLSLSLLDHPEPPKIDIKTVAPQSATGFTAGAGY